MHSMIKLQILNISNTLKHEATLNIHRIFQKMDIPITTEESIFNLEVELWGNHDYDEDYKLVIKQREKERIPFMHQSPEINYRKYIVEYLRNYAIKKRLSYSCLHLAIYLLDVFMDYHIILPEKLKLIAGVCILIAAKFEEPNKNVPKLEELKVSVKHYYSLIEYKVKEISILKFFKWNLIYPTSAHYVHYFMMTAISPSELKHSSVDHRTLLYDLQEQIKIYLDKIIEDIHYMQLYVPSRLAAAIISVARQQIGLRIWSKQLENLTGYSVQQLYEPMRALLGSNIVSYCSYCSY